VLEQALEQHRDRLTSLTSELKRHRRNQADLESEKRGLLKAYGQGKGSVRDLELVDRRLAEVAERIAELEAEAARLKDAQPDAESLRSALELFDPVWDALYPIEQARIIELLIKQVDFDGRSGKLEIEFQPVGVKLLAEELEQAEEVS